MELNDEMFYIRNVKIINKNMCYNIKINEFN